MSEINWFQTSAGHPPFLLGIDYAKGKDKLSTFILTDPTTTLDTYFDNPFLQGTTNVVK
jgi:hypothetical protein